MGHVHHPHDAENKRQPRGDNKKEGSSDESAQKLLQYEFQYDDLIQAEAVSKKINLLVKMTIMRTRQRCTDSLSISKTATT